MNNDDDNDDDENPENENLWEVKMKTGPNRGSQVKWFSLEMI